MALPERQLHSSRSKGDHVSPDDVLGALAEFKWKRRRTRITTHETAGTSVPVLTNEYWTSRQRAANSLHEISYRACFKPQLPAFFIDRLTRPGDTVYDPFAGRGTTLLEAALRGRVPVGCDINPLAHALLWPRLRPPSLADVRERLDRINLSHARNTPEQLLAFYHPETLTAITALRAYLLERTERGRLDEVDQWIRMVAVNRLTGHSPGFLSVYTLPPNQAVSVASQVRINARRGQTPPRRELRTIIMRKSATLLADMDEPTREALRAASRRGRFHTGSCTERFWRPGTIQLAVTSPPFLDVVDYAADNWLRCWFCGVDAEQVAIGLHASVTAWQAFIAMAFRRIARLLRPGGYVAFEVGEVRNGTLRLEDLVVPAGTIAGLRAIAVLVNEQSFTKTANIWGVANNRRGTNTNRIVLLRRP